MTLTIAVQLLKRISACEPGVPEKWNTWYEQRVNLKPKAAYGNIPKSLTSCISQATVAGCDEVDFLAARSGGYSVPSHVVNRWSVFSISSTDHIQYMRYSYFVITVSTQFGFISQFCFVVFEPLI